MKVHVFDIHAEKGMNLHVKGDEPYAKEILARLTADDPDGARLLRTAQLVAEVRLSREGKTVYVEGSAAADFSPPCARCLKPVATHLAPTFFLTLFPDRSGDSKEEVELSEEELDETTYQNDEIDVGLLLNEQILLERPYRVLCSEDCRGLCPTCGADLNEGPCGCPAQPGSLAFAGLKDLKLDSKDKD